MTERANRNNTTPRSHRLTFARLAWLAMAVLALGLYAAGIPHVYAEYKSVCTGIACDSPLAPEVLRGLHDLGLSAGFFAAYVLVLQTVVVLVFATVASVIFWRGPKDRMALYGSFTLLIFGAQAFSSDIPQAVAAAHPVLWFPVYLLYYIGEVCFVVFSTSSPMVGSCPAGRASSP